MPSRNLIKKCIVAVLVVVVIAYIADRKCHRKYEKQYQQLYQQFGKMNDNRISHPWQTKQQRAIVTSQEPNYYFGIPSEAGLSLGLKVKGTRAKPSLASHLLKNTFGTTATKDQQQKQKDTFQSSTTSLTIGEEWEPKANMPIIYNEATALVPAEHICKDGFQDNKELFFLMMVLSSPDHFSQRSYIRKTFGGVTRWHGREIRHAFLIAETDDVRTQTDLNQEITVFGDIVQFGFKDAFRNLTQKTSAGLNWVVRYCQNAQYVLKTDDDAAVFPQRITEYLEKLSPKDEKDLYSGGTMTTVPIRTSSGPYERYYISYKQYPYRKYPIYNRGLGILMSANVMKIFSDKTRRVPRVFSEDVFVGMLAKASGIRPSCHEGIFFSYSGSVTETGDSGVAKYCSLRNLMVFNAMDAEVSWDIYNEYVDKNITCAPMDYKYKDGCSGYSKEIVVRSV